MLHPLRVMLSLNSDAEQIPADILPDARIVAMLHDVVEDTPVTLADIRAAGFSADVLTALDFVTHKHGVSYADYVIACKPNAIARAVKLADLRDNSHPARLLLRPDKFQSDAARMQRYLLSIRYLRMKSVRKTTAA